MTPKTEDTFPGGEPQSGYQNHHIHQEQPPENMIFTFDSVSTSSASTSPVPSRGRPRIRHACEECRKRKTRCDGKKPCTSCEWYKIPDKCRYNEIQDIVTSPYEIVFKRLFPDTEPNSVLMMSDVELRRVTLEHVREEQPSLVPSISSPPSGNTNPSPEAMDNEERENLSNILVEAYHEFDGQVSSDGFSGDSALFVKHPSCYLGASSTLAALKVIDWIQPGFLHYICNNISEASSPLVDSCPEPGDFETAEYLPNPQQSSLACEEKLIEAFFFTFHPYVPILDEFAFRQTFALQQRSDHRWLGLLNIVLALGSIAAHPATDKSHYLYYQRSKHYVGLETLGESHIETIQTLGLMAGHYLHYIGQPNLAISLMGIALRLAVSVGLHREYSTGRSFEDSSVCNLRRQVWWSLVCLDTWGMESLNRPSQGRSGPGITTELPKVNVSNHKDTIDN